MTSVAESRRSFRLAVLVAAVAASGILGAAGVSVASSTERWVREGATLRAGTFEGMALAPDGTLVPGPARRTLIRPEVAVIWDVAVSEGTVHVAAGESAGLLVVPRTGGEARTLRLDDRPEVMALAAAPDGRVYAATGPEGSIWEIPAGEGEPRRVARLDAMFVWDLAVGQDGVLWAATGMPGTVTRVDIADGSSVVVWRGGEPHVRCLALDADGTVFAGTAGAGLVVRLDGAGRAFVVHDSLRPETVDLAFAGDGALWAAFAGAPGRAESGGTGEPPRRKEEASGFSESVTVRARAEGEEGGEESAKGKKPSDEPAAGRLPAGGGVIVRLPADGEPAEAWSDAKTTPMRLLPAGRDGMYVATARPARVLWLAPGGDEGWLAELPETRTASALAGGPDAFAVATSDPAAVLLFTRGGRRDTPPAWISDVLDTKTRTRFGAVRVIVPAEDADAIRALVRVGNTSEPDAGWSEWIPVPDAATPPTGAGGRVDLPRARFLQARIEADPARTGVGVARLELFYRPANRPPRITEIGVEPPGVAWRPVPPSDVTGGNRPIVELPAPPGVEASLRSNAKKGWRSKKAFEVGARTLTWAAEDPDGDPLIYRVEYCADSGTPCTDWQSLADDLERTFHSFDQRALPDGVYRFRVVASDAPGNALGEQKHAVRVSGPVLVDNTPPEIAEARAHSLGEGRVQVTFRAVDPRGRLARADVATAPDDWLQVVSDDGVVDGPEESFSLTLEQVDESGTLLLRVVDAAGNVTTRRLAAGEGRTSPR
ncbi:MAG: hypothetical protein D6738_05925 [Acidobacteria bacterium]|nr:MAG: hypothetical protein D6738_05925 [Acidobacteriota bacterium]